MEPDQRVAGTEPPHMGACANIRTSLGGTEPLCVWNNHLRTNVTRWAGASEQTGRDVLLTCQQLGTGLLRAHRPRVRCPASRTRLGRRKPTAMRLISASLLSAANSAAAYCCDLHSGTLGNQTSAGTTGGCVWNINGCLLGPTYGSVKNRCAQNRDVVAFHCDISGTDDNRIGRASRCQTVFRLAQIRQRLSTRSSHGRYEGHPGGLRMPTTTTSCTQQPRSHAPKPLVGRLG